ncbi:spore gernimation protein GerC [Paenibacillus sp. IHB B 3415]|uniref:Ger(x)C family spore germination protein n=1 Tax=Paenibacillus sp. IHB B 3415 TaxID=867080 RepID=UPI0005739F70|nr:Ger(x)C family spore germination protein [Paenibacillus sp. IHB B 3415]KHL93078.1 spore gernimation protein GerC [Paenibacillus sp. IHB B 3415]
MCRRRFFLMLCCLMLLATQTSCWSSKEIEDLALYSGLALDTGEPTVTEQALEDQGATYPKRNTITATIQLVPANSVGGTGRQSSSSSSSSDAPYLNVTGTGDSLLEIFRQYSLRLDRPIIGHHLKVIVVTTELLKQQKINQLMDFVLRDNDIRPSTMVFLSQGQAVETLVSKQKNQIPSFHIRDMIHNQRRTSKVLDPVILSKMDALMYSKRSFALQNLVTANGEVEFSGAGIIKGDTGYWVGMLNQEDTECLSWLTNEGKTGVIKTYDWNNQPMTYEMKAMKSKITANTDGGNLAFDVKVTTEGRLSETWNAEEYPSATQHAQKAEKLFREKLEQMMQALMQKLQSDYKADVAGFGERLSIQKPALWRKSEDHWDDVFSRTPIHINVELKITEFGSFTD